jgi:hypothetical protein
MLDLGDAETSLDRDLECLEHPTSRMPGCSPRDRSGEGPSSGPMIGNSQGPLELFDNLDLNGASLT